MKNNKNFFHNNRNLKILSVVLAITIWFIVMNTTNPVMLETFYTEVTFENIDELSKNNLALVNENTLLSTRIRVRTQATKDDILTFNNNNLKFKATLDFAPVDISNKNNIGKEIPVSIYVEAPDNRYSIIDFHPTSVDVYLDASVSKSFPIEVNLSGTPDNDLKILDTTLSANFVSVSGPKTLIDTIETASIDVDIDESTHNFNKIYPIKLLASDGKTITKNYSMSPESTTAYSNFSVDKVLQVHPPVITGAPAEGFDYGEVSISSDTVYVELPLEHANLNSLSLPTINVDGVDSDFEKTFHVSSILQSMGLEVVSANPTTISTNITLENTNFSKTLSVASSTIELPHDFQYTLEDNFTITVYGKEDIVNTVTSSLVVAHILDDFEEVDGSLPIQIQLPEGIFLEEPSFIKILPEDTSIEN